LLGKGRKENNKGREHVQSTQYTARHQWLIPVSLATWEAEIQRIEVQCQPRQIVLETSSPK
jgi:hypothetical protein